MIRENINPKIFHVTSLSKLPPTSQKNFLQIKRKKRTKTYRKRLLRMICVDLMEQNNENKRITEMSVGTFKLSSQNTHKSHRFSVRYPEDSSAF